MTSRARLCAEPRKRDWSASLGLAIISPKPLKDLTGYPRLPGSSVSEESHDSLIHPRQGYPILGIARSYPKYIKG